MDSTAIALVSVAVNGFTQILKLFGLRRNYNILAVGIVAAISIILWALSRGGFQREAYFDYFSNWILITLAAMGIHLTNGQVRPVAEQDPEDGSEPASSDR